MLVKSGHKVLVERSAGVGSGMDDTEYAKEGAVIVENVKDLFKKSDVIVKVKEPLESEYDLFNDGQTLFTYLHLAPNKPLTEALLRKKITGIAYETVQTLDGRLPLLEP